MEIQYLDIDELLIECSIRNLSDASEREVTEALKQALIEKLLEEKDNPIFVPELAHESARKQPRREAAICSEKLQKLKEFMLLGTKEADEDPEELRFILAKLLHVKGRLQRLASSPAVKNEISSLFKACKYLQFLVREILTKKTTLNKSSNAINKVFVPQINPEEGTQKPNSPVDSKFNPNGENINSTPHPGTSGSFVPRNPSSGDESESTEEGNQYSKGKWVAQPHYNHGVKTNNRTPKVSNTQVSGPLPLDSKVCKDPSTWNLKFEGMKSPLHIERFFYRVERMAIKAYISLEGLVDYLSLCLGGEALEWYWVYLERNSGASWEQLKQDMIQRFQANRSDDDVRRMLSQRKQMYPRETFQEFYDAILRLALQAQNPLSDQDIYRILKRNMRPGLQLELHDEQDFPPISRFIRRCVSLEDLWKRFGYNPEANLSSTTHFNQPLAARYPPRVSEIRDVESEILDQGIQEMSLDYPTTGFELNSLAAVQRPKYQVAPPRQIQHRPIGGNSTITSPNKPEDPTSSSGSKVIVCWNCGANDHLFYDCRMKINHVFCFGCGARDVYKPDCARCATRAGNSRGEVGNMRIPHLMKPNHPPRLTQLQEEVATNTDPELYQRQRM